jgi:hypothetical protein
MQEYNGLYVHFENLRMVFPVQVADSINATRLIDIGSWSQESKTAVMTAFLDPGPSR